MRIAKPVSHQNFERNLHFPLGSMSVGVLVHPHHKPHSLKRLGIREAYLFNACIQKRIDETKSNIRSYLVVISIIVLVIVIYDLKERDVMV